MNEPHDIERRISHRIPSILEPLKGLLPAALMYLARGELPETIPAGECKTVNFRVSALSEEYITRLTPMFGSRTQVILNALAWAAERNDCQKLMLISTKL